MKVASKSAGWSKPFVSAYGAVRGRRREEAIQIQLLIGDWVEAEDLWGKLSTQAV